MLGTLTAPFGTLTIETCERGVIACGTWRRAPSPRARSAQAAAHATDDSAQAARHLAATRDALHEYLTGTRQRFDDLELAPGGTAFQHAVWQALRELPYASTLSYAALAASLGRPGAARAVGRANATNPIGIIQPCHRIVGSRGALVGFAGGLAMKQWLLEHEARVWASSESEPRMMENARSTRGTRGTRRPATRVHDLGAPP